MKLGSFGETISFLRERDGFLLGCHTQPDGDAIGSLLALGLSLEAVGKRVEMVLPGGVSTVFRFLEGTEKISPEASRRPEVVISLDCAERSRLCLPEWVFDHNPLVLNIDHHISNDSFGDLNLIFPDLAATGQIVYGLLKTGEFPIDQRIAVAVYTAVATDTGFFRFSNTSGEVIKLAAELVDKYQFSPSYIAEHVYEERTYLSVRLMGAVLSTLQLSEDKKVSWMVMDQEALERFPVELEETENFVNYASSIRGVEVGLLFKEIQPGEVKVSWRSKEPVDVSILAANFGGGGHARAAGCTLNGSVSEAVDKVLFSLKNYFLQREMEKVQTSVGPE